MEVRMMIEIQNPFDGDVSDLSIERWLLQFKPDEYPIIKKLLANFRYYSSKKVNNSLTNLHNKIKGHLRVEPENIWFIPVGYVAKSGSAVAYFYKKQNDVPQNRFISSRELSPNRLSQNTAVVFLDDFIGSGHQATEVWRNVLKPIVPETSPCPIVFGALVGFERGIRYLEENTKFKVVVVDEITEADLPLSKESKIFENEEEKDQARVILRRYGEMLYPRYPLGYEDSQGLIGFFYSTPNNTFPIFWATGAEWEPLLPRAESFRDPASLVGPPSGLTKGIASERPDRPIIESSELDKYDIPEEMAVKIFREFRSPPVYLVLAPILKSLKIDEKTFSDLLHLINFDTLTRGRAKPSN
jgi:hypothetical protein